MVKENRIAIVKDEIIVNVIVASDDFANNMPELTVNVTDKGVGIGWKHNQDDTFSHPDTLLSVEELLVKKTNEEKTWRDKEFIRTDKLAMLPDYEPKGTLLTYRGLLRKYDTSVGFPNKDNRPVLSASLKETLITKFQFLSRFTKQELKSIFDAKKVSTDLEVWLELFKVADIIDIELQETIDGINMLEQLEIIVVGRAAEILE